MSTSSMRFINLPAAVVAILIRKLFDTYTSSYAGVTDLALPSGLRAFENYLRHLMRFNGMNIYFIGAAASSFLYYLKKFKIIRIIRRPRESIACGTTNSVLRRSTLQINRSLKMLFNRDDKFLSYMKRCSFPMSRRSRIQATGSSATICNGRNTAYSAPSNMRQSPAPASDSCDSLGVAGVFHLPPAQDQVAPVVREAAPFAARQHLPLTIGLDIQRAPRRSQLQDVHGNVYDCRSLTMRLPDADGDCTCDDSEPCDLMPPPPLPPLPLPPMSAMTGFTTTFQSDGECCSQVPDNMDVFTPSVIREILPSAIDVGSYRLAGVRMRRAAKGAKPAPARARRGRPQLPKRRKVAERGGRRSGRSGDGVDRSRSEGKTGLKLQRVTRNLSEKRASKDK